MEIGSEYWKYDGNLINDNSEFWNLGKDTKFVLSGRTAIFYCLRNILFEKNVQKAYLPSYSCSSMAQAFIDLGIEVEYYDVYFNEELKYNIDLENDSDIFFAMNYFGYSETNMEKYIKKFKEKGKIVIEDITHSILSEKRFSEYSDYLIASLRKWFPVSSGAIAVSCNKKFSIEIAKNTNQKMIDLKQSAMENKKQFMKQEKIKSHKDILEIDLEKNSKLSNNKNCELNKNYIENKKEQFLKEYSESNKILENDYQNYSIDEESFKIVMGIDIEEIKQRRKENARVIYEKLSKNLKIRFLVNNLNEKDCLIFIPIILDNKIRNDLKKYLIEKKVYLPVHWPMEKKINNIFEKELSLICDQRYTKTQIEEYVNLILEFLNILENKRKFIK